MRSREWCWFLALAWAAAAVAGAAGHGPVAYALHVLVGGASVVAVGRGIARHGPSRPVAWQALAVAVGAWLVGDVVFFGVRDVGGPELSWLATLCFATAYVATAVALVLLARSHGPLRRSEGRLDAALVTVPAALLSWIFLVTPSWESSFGEPVPVRLLVAAYPLGNVVLVATAARLVAVCGLRASAPRMILGAVLLLTLADSWWQVLRLDGAASPGPLRVAWLLGYALLGATALHPAMRSLSNADLRASERPSRGRLAVLAGAVLVLPAILAAQLLAGARLSVWPVLAATPAIVAIVFMRMTLLVGRLAEQAARLGRLTDLDHATGLVNRRRFTDDLAALLAGRNPAVVMLVGVDRVSELVELVGDTWSDDVLRATGRRLRALAGPGAVVGRVGGGAFAVLDQGATTPETARALAARMRDAAARPHRLPDLSLTIEVAVGIVLVPRDAHGAATALRRAEVALRAAWAQPEHVAVFTPDLDLLEPSARVLREVRDALASGQITLHYQPQLDLATGRVHAVEALARWIHPERGVVPPGEFIPAVEHGDLVDRFTAHVLDTALAQCARWRRDGLALTVAVNLSTRNLVEGALVEQVAAALSRHGVGASALELEITETSAMADPRRSLEVVSALAAMGVAFSIDDYGTGYSSLAYLQQLPVRRLKIDRSFVAGILGDPASRAIVRSTLELARNLGLEVVAEGVEDDDTLLRLREMGCEWAQGFGIGRPAPAAEIDALVAGIEARMPALMMAATPLVPSQRGVPLPSG